MSSVDNQLIPYYIYLMTQTLVEYIKQYALDHYEDGGWDVIVECWDTQDIQEHLVSEGATTEAQAVKAFANMVSYWSDQQADAINSAF